MLNQEFNGETHCNGEEVSQENDDFETQKIKIIVKELKFKLTQSELDAKMNELVKIHNFEIPVLEETKKLAMKKYNNEIETLQSQAFKLGSIYNDKAENRNCDCVWRYNRQTKKMDLCRLAFKVPEYQDMYGEELSTMRDDLVCNGSEPWESYTWYPSIVIETRDLTPEERQLELDLKKKAEVKPPEPKPEPEPEILTSVETAPVKKKEKRSK